MAASAQARDWRLDALRGAAIVAMVVYHFFWDLAAFGFIDPAEATRPGFRRLGATIAGAFLLISGVALVLLRRREVDDNAFRSKFLRRLAIIAAAAALVSLGTWFAMGDRFVRFGILHCIAAASVIALPFLRTPSWTAAAAGFGLLALPWLVDLPAFSHPTLLWLGLSTRVPAMVDFVPVFPFAGMMLLGVAAGPTVAAQLAEAASEPGFLAKGLASLGRWSLPIYLIHQPILYGALMVAAAAMSPARDGSGLDRDTAGFRSECRRSCETQHGKAHCEVYCACMETEMKATDLWRRAMSDSHAATLQTELQPVIQACFAKAREGR
jgi:uncharacterized membrane protein